MESADRFYGHLLGLERIRSFMIPSELSRDLFGFDHRLQALTYLKNDMCFEVFVVDEPHPPSPPLCHVALVVEDQKGFLERCDRVQVRVIKVSRGGKSVTMIKDYDGNLFEIKEAT
jgi:catechol 2,3-dioxygenase-like lactoylglutathione lyase family enzyme